MTAFADSSALVKLYSDEEGHHQVRSLEPIVVSAIARVEVPAAFWRKQRIGELDASHAAALTRAFEADYLGTESEPPQFAVLSMGDHVLDEAASLVAQHGLRAYDALQLSSALAARTADPACETFACFDLELRTAAAASGFLLIP